MIRQRRGPFRLCLLGFKCWAGGLREERKRLSLENGALGVDIKRSDVAECSCILNNWGYAVAVNRGGEQPFTWNTPGTWELSRFRLGRLVSFQNKPFLRHLYRTGKPHPYVCLGLGLSQHEAAQLFPQQLLIHSR